MWRGAQKRAQVGSWASVPVIRIAQLLCSRWNSVFWGMKGHFPFSRIRLLMTFCLEAGSKNVSLHRVADLSQVWNEKTRIPGGEWYLVSGRLCLAPGTPSRLGAQ